VRRWRDKSVPPHLESGFAIESAWLRAGRDRRAHLVEELDEQAWEASADTAVDALEPSRLQPVVLDTCEEGDPFSLDETQVTEVSVLNVTHQDW